MFWMLYSKSCTFYGNIAGPDIITRAVLHMFPNMKATCELTWSREFIIIQQSFESGRL